MIVVAKLGTSSVTWTFTSFEAPVSRSLTRTVSGMSDGNAPTVPTTALIVSSLSVPRLCPGAAYL